MRVSEALLAGAMALSAAACSDDGHTDASAATASTPPGAASDSPAFDIEAFCEKTVGVGRPCQGDDAVLEGNKVGYCATLLRAARDEKRAHFDAAAASACAAAVASAEPPLPDRRKLHDLSDRFAACAEVVVGEQAAGSACDRTMECTPGLVCAAKICHAPKALGEDCVAIREEGAPAARSSCGPDLRCDGGRCGALAKAGGACKSAEQCATGLACRAGRCLVADPLAAGASCAASDECAADLYCAGKPGKCATRKRAGEPCESPDACVGLCSREAGQHCVAYCGSG